MVSALLAPIFERNQEATLYIGNIDRRVNQQILWELFMQCGPVVNIHLPRDKITNQHNGFGFVEFRGEEDANYAIKIMHLVKLYGKAIKVNKASQDKKNQEIGAKLYVGNLSDQISDQNLKDVFSKFGITTSTRIMRDQTGRSQGHGFVCFDNFDSADLAIQQLNGQFIGGKNIEVNYALKKGAKGEMHGSAAERILAANRPDFKPIMITPMNAMNSSKVVYNEFEMQPPPPPLPQSSQSFPPPPPPSKLEDMMLRGPDGKILMPPAAVQAQFPPPPPPPPSYPYSQM